MRVGSLLPVPVAGTRVPVGPYRVEFYRRSAAHYFLTPCSELCVEKNMVFLTLRCAATDNARENNVTLLRTIVSAYASRL